MWQFAVSIDIVLRWYVILYDKCVLLVSWLLVVMPLEPLERLFSSTRPVSQMSHVLISIPLPHTHMTQQISIVHQHWIVKSLPHYTTVKRMMICYRQQHPQVVDVG